MYCRPSREYWVARVVRATQRRTGRFQVSISQNRLNYCESKGKGRKTPNPSQTIPCVLCGKLFFSVGTMRRHVATSAKHGDKRYGVVCCDVLFCIMGFLLRHTNTILDYEKCVSFLFRDFPCQYCTYRAKQKYDLKMHILSKHPERLIGLAWISWWICLYSHRVVGLLILSTVGCV